MKGRIKSLLACVLAVLMMNSCIMPDLSFAEDFSNTQLENQPNTLETRGVAETVYATSTAVPMPSALIEPVITPTPDVTLTPTPTLELSTDIPDEESSIMLPLEVGSEAEKSVTLEGVVTKTAKVLNTSFDYRDAPLTDSEAVDESIQEIKEGEVIILNDESSTEKNSYLTISFTPTTSETFIVTASKETLSYMYITDSKGNTVINIRTYPEYSNSVACKLYKDRQYKIGLDVDENLPTELMVKKYESVNSEVIYKFSNNTYTGEDRASIIVDMPALPADILFAALERDIVFGAELIKDGVTIDKISEISKDCIRGATGTPDDNFLQLACNFSEYVEYGDYTIKITCNDLAGNPVIESCEAEVELGNKVTIYIPENSTSIVGHDEFYLNKVNAGTGKFLLLNDEKIIGMSDLTSIRETRVDHDFYGSYYRSTNHEYSEENFGRTLYYADIPNISFNGTLKTGNEYSMRFVTGASEFETPAEVVVTKALIIEDLYHNWNLRESSDNYIVTANFSNIANADIEKIDIEMVDTYGKVVASKVNYSYGYNESEIKFRLKINSAIDITNRYSVRISYPGEIYINAEEVSFWAYNYGDKLSIESVRIADTERADIVVSTQWCDKSIDYDVVLYRYNNSLHIPISKITGASSDEDGVFSLQFPQQSDLPLLTQGGTYELRFLYEGNIISSKQFSMPALNDIADVDTNLSFYPPVLPSEGNVEFTISGYEIDNGIMGADNENVNIELIADNEVYGSLDNATIEKSVSVYRTTGNYNVGQVMIKGILKINKALKGETKYFIRINGTDYEYFYNSADQKIYADCFSIYDYKDYINYSSFVDSEGNNQLYYILNNNEELKLGCSWVRDISEAAELIFVNVDTKEEINAGIWNTVETYYDGTFKEISIEADLTEVIPGDIYEICLKDGEQNYSFNKYIQFPKTTAASYFTVREAVYGSDVFTLSFDRSTTIDGYGFNIVDSLDNIINCTQVGERVDNRMIYVDLKLDTPLKYGFYKIQMYNAKNVVKYASTYYVSEKKGTPSLEYVKEGFPFLLYCTNLIAGSSYTADIFDIDTAVRLKKDISLTERTGEDVLEINQKDLDSLSIGNYSIAVKADGKLVGSQTFYYSGSFELKPVITASEWDEGINKRPFVSSNNVKFDLRTLYYTKVRYSESVENLQTTDYQTVTNNVYYTFDSTDRVKILYFQFSDDYQNESDVRTFKAYLNDNKNVITIISPEEGLEYNSNLTALAKVTNNPYFVGAVLYKGDSYSNLARELIRTEGTDNYSNVLSSGIATLASITYAESYLQDGISVEVFTTDEVGNITGSKIVNLKKNGQTPESPYVSVTTSYGDKKSDLNIKGNTTNGAGNVTIYAYAKSNNSYYNSWASYSVVLLADAKGNFEGTLNIPVDRDYKIVARDFKGTQSYNQYIKIDTIAPVLKDYTTVAQGIESVRISWDVTDVNNCTYAIWKDGNILTSGYSSREYITAGLTKGQTYVYKIVATDIMGNSSEPVEISVTVGDEEVPSMPQNLAVLSHASKSITLSWKVSTDNSYVAGYEIYRDGEKVGISYTTEYTDESLETGVEHSYKVRAFDPSMNFSGFAESIAHASVASEIKDAYDGSYSVVGYMTKKLVLKALTTDNMNKDGISVSFEYRSGESTSWMTINAITNTYTVTTNGLLFSTSWNVEYMPKGDYTIRYTMKDRDGYTSEALSQPISILEAQDNEAPKIVSIKPDPSSFANNIPLRITAVDNIRVKKITIQTSLDKVNWSDSYSEFLSYMSNKVDFYYNLDTSEVREGYFYVRVIAEDVGGNVSNSTETYNEYVIDRTAPEKVQNISGYSYVDCIEIRWNNNSEPYVKGFTVLRAFEPTGIYTTVAYEVKSLNYFDTSAVPGETYYYKVICKDVAGNESPDSDPIEVTMLDVGSIVDTVKPEITSVYPENNIVIGNTLTYALTAYDDVRLSKLAAEYSLDGEEWIEFHAISSEYSIDGFTAELDTASFTTGTVLKTRGYAVDIKGNTSDYRFCDYIIDNVAPKTLVIGVEPIARGFVITWTCDETDIASYKLYRRNAESEFYTVVGEYSNTILSVVDKNLDPSKKYIYKIIAMDSLGNNSSMLSEAVSPLDIDEILPSPYINCVSSAEVGTEVEFDASASKDNVGIAKYIWDLGDGTIEEGVRVTHSYIKAGEYKVVLRVEDFVGNEETAERAITILEKNISGILNIAVTDNLGNNVPYANIYVNVGTVDQFKILTDSNGRMSLKLESGSYDIGAYKEGYSPKQQDVLISENEENNLSFVLEDSKIVIGNITATKLSLDEIKAAGIDVTAPGNQNVFRYEINLNYNNKPYSISHTSSSSGSGSSGFSGGSYSVGGRDVEVRTVTNPKTNETFILLIDIPGRVTWLKEFFDVKLHLINTGGTYDLNDCFATLNIPEGISIAGGNDQTVSIGTIEARGSKTLDWIIRGDKPGSYSLSADFKGVLETFNEQVLASFVTENPIVVDDSSGLRLIIEVEKAKYPEDDLLYRVGFKNEKNSDIYMPNISMGDSTFLRSYKTKDNMSLVKTSRSVLAPGEILWEEYSADSELFEGYENRSMLLKELGSKALGGLEMPIETRMVDYGTFGRVKTQIYVMDVSGERKVDLLTITKYRSKENDKMLSLKITSGRGISEDVIVHEECELTINDTMKNTTSTVRTDSNGEYIYDGYSIDDIQVGDSGIDNYTIVVSSDTTRKIKSTQRIRIVDQNLLPAEDFGTISGRVLDKDVYIPIENATITVDTYKTQTDSDGKFKFEDILLQDDRITIEAQGFPKKTIDEELSDGSYVSILMSRMPEVTKVTSAVSDSTKPISSILPLNLVTGSITFMVTVDLKDAGEVTKYLYKIVSKSGTIKYSGESTSSIIKVENIRSKMSMGDRILFAIEAEGTYGKATSDYVDAKLVMAKEFPFLNAVSWLNDLENAFEDSFETEIEDGLDGFMEFTTGEEMPRIGMPSDSGPLKSLGLTSAGFDFDLDVKYDFYNAKATFTTKAGSKFGANGSFAEFDVPDSVDAFLGAGIESENEVTLSLICVYNDNTLEWEIESYKVVIASETEIKILSFEFKFRVPLDAYFGGALLSGYVSLEINGTLTFITNVTIGGLGSFDSIEEMMIDFQLIIGITLRAAIGLEVGYGLLGGEFWAQGGIEFTVPTCKTVLSLAIGHKETYVWFISHEETIAEEEWVVYDPEARQAERDDNNRANVTSEVKRLEKKSVKREAYAAPDVNAASEGSLFETSPRDYLKNQKWIGGEEIIQYAYPQSDAKISEIDEKYGDLIMVYVGDDRERTDNNRTSLYYSIYDNEKWSEPKQVENDGTADAFPNLSSDSENTYAIWLDMPEKIGNLPKVSEDYITKNIISKMKVTVAKFDYQKASWENISSPETEGLDKLPQISAEGEKTIATWVNNLGKEAIGTEEKPDDIYFVYNNGTSWTAPKAFITNAENVNESDLLLHNGKAYFVYTTNAYSKDGLYKLYSSIFDGKTWSKPRGVLDNIHNDRHPSIAVENGKPVVFWQNDELIYKAQIESGRKEIVVNSDQAFGLQELEATNTDEGIALAWTNAIGGEQKLFISTYEDVSSTWTQGIELKHNSMGIPRHITLAGNTDEIMAVYNKSVYKQKEENSEYYYEGTSLTSTSYVRKIDLAIPANGIYFENETVMPGEESKVYVAVENTGDLTAKNISVALYDGDKLINKKVMSQSLSHGSSLIAEFVCRIPADYSGLNLKGIVEVANDGDTSNNTSKLDLSFTDVEITNIYNALYERNRGYVYVDVTNNGFTTINSTTVQIYTDKEFKNLIGSKEIKNLYPTLTKRSGLEFEVSDEQVENRVRLYAKVIVEQTEFDYTNNSDFTIVRPTEYTATPAPVTPAPVTPGPVTPGPVTPEPTPTTDNSPKPDPTGSTGGSSGSTGGSTGSTGGSTGSTGTTPISTPTPTPKPEVTETPEPIIPGSNGKNKGYMRGYEDKSFRPENKITRAEMAVILANLDGVAKSDIGDILFKDVSLKHWAVWAIKYVTHKGYFKGYEDNTFRPDDYITRAELSVVLCKYLNYNEQVESSTVNLTDIAGHWAEDYISILTAKGYIKGYSDKTFRPNNNIKRSECAALINRSIGLETPREMESQFTDVDKNHWAYKDIMLATQN